MLECRGQVRALDPPSSSSGWQLHRAQSGIPFVTDGTVKKWAMHVFQEKNNSAENDVDQGPPDLDVENAIATSDDQHVGTPSPTVNSPPPPKMPGFTAPSGDLVYGFKK